MLKPEESIYHKTQYKWDVYYHLPFDKDWTLNSYKKIFTFDTIEEGLFVFDELDNNVLEKCMLFVMKDGITPIWEDEKNKNGSCISFKVLSDDVYRTWKDTIIKIICGDISDTNYMIDCNENNYMETINGISLSPKKNFSILKIWLSTTNIKDSNVYNKLNLLDHKNCIIKKHIE